MNHPSFLRPLDPVEDDRSKRVYEALQANISLRSDGAPAARLERTRVLNAQGGLNWSDAEHLRALVKVAEETGDEEAGSSCPEIWDSNERRSFSTTLPRSSRGTI